MEVCTLLQDVIAGRALLCPLRFLWRGFFVIDLKGVIQIFLMIL
jgi:hypothetical protein